MSYKDSSVGAAMKRVSLLVDGMARAAILPFGPRLIHRLAFHPNWFGAANELKAATWSKVAYPMADMVGIYALGRSLGVYFSQQVPLTQAKLPLYVARLGGISFALHLFTFGAGLNSVRWLVLIRLLSAVIAGFICGIADVDLPEDECLEAIRENDEELMEQGLIAEDNRIKKRMQYVDVTPATAKIYMAAVTVTILTGGLLYHEISTSEVMQGLTGGRPFTASPLFFAAVTAAVEFTLRCVFEYSRNGPNCTNDDMDSNAAQNDGAVTRFVNTVVKRRVRISNTTTAYSPVAANVSDIHDEFHDPLSLSKHASYRGTPNRARLNSSRSEASEFFDCNSTFNEEMIDLDADPHTSDVGNASLSTVAVYKDGRCVYPDGSPAFVPPGECIGNIPQNYLEFYRGNEDKAMAKYAATQEWRREEGVWEIHRTPHPLFERIKEAYPHIIHGHSKTGQVVIYENPGKMNLKQLFRSGCNVSDMLMHMTFFLEYIGNCISSRSEIRELNGGEIDFGTMVVMDVKGASISSLTGDVLSYLSQSGALQSAHYPSVLKRVFVVNCPFWLAGAWSTVKGIVPESVHVEILSESNALVALQKYIDDDQIPPEYGGSSPYALGQHPYETGCFEVAEKAGTFERTQVGDSIPVEPAVLDNSYSFDHKEQSWTHDEFIENRDNTFRDVSNVSKIVDDASWRKEPKTTKPLRRRTFSQENRREEIIPMIDNSDDRVCADGGEGGILFLVSFMYIFWCSVQGAIETVVPLWLLSPALLGGLGYSPSRSGMVLFSVSMVLLWNMRTKVARVVSQLPNKSPMRAFRIAVGSEAMCLALLFMIPSYASFIPRTESVWVMTSTIIFLSCTALASMLGRAGLSILHRIASENFAQNGDAGSIWISRLYGSDKLLADCESGRFTWLLRLSGELSGIAVAAPLYCWSTAQERPAPFDASCVLFVSSLVSFVLYVSSFSLHLNVVGEFAPHPRESGCGGEANARKCCSFVGEVCSVSVGDMASLMEEANWSRTSYSTPLSVGAGRRDRVFSVDRSLHQVTKSI